MSKFSRIFSTNFIKYITRTTTIISGSAFVHENKSSNVSNNDDDCETPICNDATEAISKYSGFNLRNRMDDIPPDRQILGRHTWTLLHCQAMYYPENPTKEEKDNMLQFLILLSKTYPCKICANDLENLLEIMPPKLDSKDEFKEWMCDLHNEVNKQLNKKIFNCNDYDKRWNRSLTHNWHDIETMKTMYDDDVNDDEYY